MDLQALKGTVLENGVVTEDNVNQIAAAIYDEAGEDGAGVSRNEADILFEISDATADADNDPKWNPLFVEGVSKHVLEDEGSPNEIDEGESTYLMDKIGADGRCIPVEMTLLLNVAEKATSIPEALNTFIIDKLKAAVIEDGIIDAPECANIAKVIYGEGGGDGAGVSTEEADLLFELNDATSGKDNAPEWQTLFVEGVSKHVLEDEDSPNEIDEPEADYLIAKVQKDGEYDTNEIVLFANLKEKATKVHEKMTFQFDLMNI